MLADGQNQKENDDKLYYVEDAFDEDSVASEVIKKENDDEQYDDHG